MNISNGGSDGMQPLTSERSTPIMHIAMRDLAMTFGKVGMLSFGGPAAQIALMHQVLVEQRRWLDERRFLGALSFCMLLPGPEAMQLATYAGWRLRGVAGGLVAGLLFVLPGAALVLALSILYGFYSAAPAIATLFVGLKAAVLAIVLQALIRIAQRAMEGAMDWAAAIAGFVAIYFFDLPFPLVIALAGLAGFLFRPAASHNPASERPAPVALRATLKTLVVWLTVWIAPLLLIVAIFGDSHVLAQLALFFSRLAVVTFGGAYAVLAYMAQEAVSGYGWLSAGEMLDGLALAETTNGPLILVTEFVGYIAVFKQGGVCLGILGAMVALWATFAPCFLWIFVGAPYIDILTHSPRLSAALRTITAVVVGVIANLSVWFAMHVLFNTIDERHVGPLRLYVPDIATVDWFALALTVLGLVSVFVLRLGIVATLSLCAAASFVWLQLIA
ncbi:chromate efflux transporter [Hyphomicrobium sulfonivorans]|nr:chromate efflux transporter [Hyphomicrobium sulfonivorans]